MIIRLHPTAGGIALVTPKGYEFLTHENGHPISFPKSSRFRPKTLLPERR